MLEKKSASAKKITRGMVTGCLSCLVENALALPRYFFSFWIA